MKPIVATALLLLLCQLTRAAPPGQNSDPDPKESSNVQRPSQELEVPFDRDTLPGYDFSYTYYGVGPKVQSGGEQSVRQGKGLDKIFKAPEAPSVEVGPEHTTDSQDTDRDTVKTQGKEHAKEAQVVIPAAPAPDDSGSDEMINDFDDDGVYDARDETQQKQPGQSSQDTAVQNNPRAKRQLIVGLGVPFGYGYGGYGYGYGYGRPWGYGGYYRRPWGYGGYGYGRPWGGRWRG